MALSLETLHRLNTMIVMGVYNDCLSIHEVFNVLKSRTAALS